VWASINIGNIHCGRNPPPKTKKSASNRYRFF
jgi:hypothetical protein